MGWDGVCVLYLGGKSGDGLSRRALSKSPLDRTRGVPSQREPGWTKPRDSGTPAAYVGPDAFSVPMQGAGAGPAEHRMLSTALVYTPDKKYHRYLVDFELDVLAEESRSQVRAAG